MPNKQLAAVLSAMGNKTRLELLDRLSRAETFAGLSIVELAEPTGFARQTITRHLEALERAGLVSRLKLGRATWYELKTEDLENAIRSLEAIVEQRARSVHSLKSAMKRQDGRSPLRL